MNKKFFTLIVGLLLTCIVGTISAQSFSRVNLPAGLGQQILTLNNEHYVQLGLYTADWVAPALPGSMLAAIEDNSGQYYLASVTSTQVPLANTLWKVDWRADANSHQILFTFTNKASQEALSINYTDLTIHSINGAATTGGIPTIGGGIAEWNWSNIVSEVGGTVEFIDHPLSANFSATPDSIITFVRSTSTVTYNNPDGGAPATLAGVTGVRSASNNIPTNAYRIVPFWANPIALTAYDLNTRLWTSQRDGTGLPYLHKVEDFDLTFTPNVISDGVNVYGNLFTENTFIAEESNGFFAHPANQNAAYTAAYQATIQGDKVETWVRMKLKTDKAADYGKYLYVDTNFVTPPATTQYNDLQLRFAIDTLNSASVVTVPTYLTQDYLNAMENRARFQFTWYPTQDSMHIKAGNADLKREYDPTVPATAAWRYWKMGIAAAPAAFPADYVSVAPFIWKDEANRPRTARNGTIFPAAGPVGDLAQGKMVKLTYLANNHSEVTVGKFDNAPAGVSPALTLWTRISLGQDGRTTRVRTTLEDGLYFIKNKYATGSLADSYKIVHLSNDLQWSQEDNAQLFGTSQDFGHMPATQWVVEQTDNGKPGEYRVNIYNREYPNIYYYPNVQLYKAGDKGQYFEILYPTGASGMLFAGEVADFVPVSTQKPKVPEAYNYTYLGYYDLDSLELSRKIYNLEYFNGIAIGNYIAVKDSRTDSIIYVDVKGNKVVLALETAPIKAEGYYGYQGRLTKGTSKKFEALRRKAYNIRIKDSNLLIANLKYVVENWGATATSEPMYAISDVRKPEAATFFLKENNRLVLDGEPTTGTPFYSLVNAQYGSTLFGIAATDTLWREPWFNNTGIVNRVGAWGNVDYRAGVKDGSLAASIEMRAEKRIAAFAVRPADTWLYRRFDGRMYGGVQEDYKGADAKDINSPLWLKFAKYNNWGTDGSNFLAENSPKNVGVDGYVRNFRDSLVNDKNISFAGIYNRHQFPEAADRVSYTFYVDTAYVRYDTPMPQYMLAIRPTFGATDTVWCQDPHHDGQTHQDPDWINCPHTIIPYPMVKAEWLFNAQDSVNVGNIDYLGKFSYGAKDLTRLAFVHGIHAKDTFYVLRDPAMIAKKAEQIKKEDLFKIPAYDKHYLGENTHFKERWTSTAYDKARKAYNFTDKNGKYVDDYNGKSMVFQFRLIDLKDRRFLFETTRDPLDLEIGPTSGQWVKFQNDVPVIGAKWTNVANAQQSSADIFDVTLGEENNAISNEEVAAEASFKVIAGYGEVTVIGAADKKVTVSNILGQTVATKVLGSDNETVSLPKGIVVVSVDGEKAVKAVVK